MIFTSNRDIAVSVRDLAFSRKFYEETLGFKPETVEDDLVVYNTGHFTLYVQEGEPHPPVPSFRISSFWEVKKYLQEAGCVIVSERNSSLYFRDPDGNLWDIIEG